jgi:hypothetical protein
MKLDTRASPRSYPLPCADDGSYRVGNHLPEWVVAAVMLPSLLGILWWLMYTSFRDRDRAFRERDRLKSQGD